MKFLNILRPNFWKYGAPVLLSLLSASYVVQAQVVNPSQPATGVPVAGTGIAVAGQTVSVNYGVANSPFTGNMTIGGTLGVTGTSTLGATNATTLSASSTVSGAGFTAFMASPPTIGSTAANSGAFTTLANSSTFTSTGAAVLNGAVSGTGIASYEANINHVQTVANVTALRAVSCVPGLLYGDQGYSTIGDGGNSIYVCNGADTTTPDNGCNVLATASTFRLYLQYTQSFSVRQCGATGNGVTDDTTAIQNAATFVYSNFGAGSTWGYKGTQKLVFPPGTYILSNAITINGPIHLEGEGRPEFSTEARLIQTAANTDLFTFVAINGGLSFSVENLSLSSNAGAGTGNLINVQQPRPASGSAGWNSWKVIHTVLANPQNAAIRATGDDIEINNNVFDVSTFNGPSVNLGTLAIAQPTVATGVGSTTGGTLPAANYFTKIVAVDMDGRTQLPSPESTVVTTTGSTSSIAYTWTAVTNAASYQIWFSNTTGTEAQYFTSKTPAFTLTTTTGATSGTIPSSNTSQNFAATDVRIQSNNFFNVPSHVILAYDTFNVNVSANIVSQPNSSTTTFSFFDGIDAVGVQNQNIVLESNTFYGLRRIGAFNAGKQIVVNGNTCWNCGTNSSETVSPYTFNGATSDVSISGNIVQGGYGANSAVAAGGASGGPIVVVGNSFNNTAVSGSPIAVNINTAAGTISNNAVAGWTIPAFATDLYAVGYQKLSLNTLTYGTTVTPDASIGAEMLLNVTNTTAYTMAAPLNPSSGQRIDILIRNASGGTMGTVTWNAAYHMTAFTNPANGLATTMSFMYVGSLGYWIEVGRSSTTVPN